jgi:hypothetical protein
MARFILRLNTQVSQPVRGADDDPLVPWQLFKPVYPDGMKANLLSWLLRSLRRGTVLRLTHEQVEKAAVLVLGY